MEVILGLLALAWLVSPIILAVSLHIAKADRRRRDAALWQFYHEGKISDADMRAAGLDVPRAVQVSGMGVSPPVTQQADAPQSPIPVLPAAERAAEKPAEIPAPAAAELPAAQIHPVPPQPVFQKPTMQGQVVMSYTQPEPAVQTPAQIPQIPEQTRVRSFHVSSLTVMLSVGVVLVIVAGLLFVRSAWDSLGAFGRLATLAAGSLLFFGTSELARRVWNLERTGMAFFTLGAAFLPISVWAAGYLHLLGDGLAGSSNKWLIALAFLSFTVIALIAVRLYQQRGWGIGFLAGLSLTWIYLARAFTEPLDGGTRWAVMLISLYAAVLAFAARPLRERLPLPIAAVLEPFAVGLIFFDLILQFTLLQKSTDASAAAAFAGFFCAAAFFAPALTDRLREFTALPAAIPTLLGFAMLFRPLLGDLSSTRPAAAVTMTYTALVFLASASANLILLLTNSLPDRTQCGFRYAAYVMTGLSVPFRLAMLGMTDSTANAPIPASALLLGAGILLTVLTLLLIRRTESKTLPALSALAACMSITDLGIRLMTLIPDVHASLLTASLLLICAGLFSCSARLRTWFSDLLLPLSAAFFCVESVLQLSEWKSAAPVWGYAAAFGMLAAVTVQYYFRALIPDKRLWRQHVYAALVPAMLSLMLLLAALEIDGVNFDYLYLGWLAASCALAYPVYLAAKQDFHSVRQVMFGLLLIPALGSVLFAQSICTVTYAKWAMLLCTTASVGLYLISAKRGAKYMPVVFLAASAILLPKLTCFSVSASVYAGETNLTVYMIGALWTIALSILAVIIRKQILFFTGSVAIPAVMQVIAPLSALYLSVYLLALPRVEWDGFYFVFVSALCVLAWFTTKPSQIVLPFTAVLSLIFSMEALRVNTHTEGNLRVILLIAAFTGMTLLFPYLGVVLREQPADPIQQRRTWTLTAAGGIIPFWLTEVTMNPRSVDYTDMQLRWMIFFVPVLLAGFILHFAFTAKDEPTRKGIFTAAAALGTVALWIQPVVDVNGTYWDGKLHLLPLIAFGALLRYLYGEKTGSGFLFAIGIYSMLRLAFSAIASESGADIATLLTTALVMFLLSFYIKQKKWFLLGGISLLLTAVYLHMKLTNGAQWWLYLAAAGIVLIAVAAANERLKARGDSLKDRAGRLWDDWTW